MTHQVDVLRGDITAQHVDAVVNAANRRMRGGGGVDGAIHAAGGPTILRACEERFPDGLATGEAGWTTAGDLPASWVIHVVGPNFAAGERDAALLAACYSNALRIADELGARTLAFPLVSAGIFSWPLDDAASIAVRTLTQTSTDAQVSTLVAFDAPAYEALRCALEGVNYGP